jgi:hypothetical protein
MRFRMSNRFTESTAKGKDPLTESERLIKTRLYLTSHVNLTTTNFLYFRNFAPNTALLELKNKSLNINKKAALSTD